MKNRYFKSCYKYFLLSLFVSFQVIYAEGNQHIFHKMAHEAAEYQKKEIIYLDNAFVQTYNGQFGLWRFVESQRMAYNMSKKYGVKMQQIKDLNPTVDQDTFTFNRWLFIPYSQDYYDKYKKIGIFRQGWPTLKGEFIWPVLGSRITSRVGKRWGISHKGLDVATGTGGIVLAAQSGVVVKAEVSGGYGILISLEHEHGYHTRYAHLSQALVREGDQVKKGQIIAFSGNSGRSTGPHLHFEVQCGGMHLDPENFLPKFKDSMEASYGFRDDIFDKLKVQN